MAVINNDVKDMINEYGDKIWYNSNRLMSYSDALWYFCCGGRGCGKTYHFKKKMIKLYLKHGYKWVYIRRYKTELKNKMSFLDDVAAEFPKHKFKVVGDVMYCDNKRMGNIISLSTNKSGKGSVFTDVTNVVFDEFMFETDRFYNYLDNEVQTFFEMFESVARLNDAKIIMLANSISTINPYFVHFGIEPKTQRKGDKPIESVITKTTVNGVRIITEYYYNDYYEKIKGQTKFGQLITGTRYGDYLISNKNLKGDNLFIEEKYKDSRYCFSLKHKGFTIGVWYSSRKGLIYISNQHDPNSSRVYISNPKEFTGTEFLVKDYKKFQDVNTLKRSFLNNECRFSNNIVKDIFYNIIKEWHIM